MPWSWMNNGNRRWYDATKIKMDQINVYQVFKDHGKAKYNPKDHQCAPRLPEDQCTPSFVCRHDGHHKARLVTAGNLTPDQIDRHLFWSSFN